MPLKCKTNTGETLLAFNYDAVDWQKLIDGNRREKHLVMPCCGRPVVLKTSHLRTRFFAHARKDGSKCPRESEAHLFAKTLIAKAIVQAGWQAETEVTLKPANLKVDVLATKGKHRIAFEVQLSRQKEQVTAKRHAAYEKAGVRALWLFKQWDYPLCKAVPAFRLASDMEGRAFNVWVWREGPHYEKTSQPAQTVDLTEFIAGALVGKLKWQPAVGLTVPVTAWIAQSTCRKGHSTPALVFLEVCVNRALPGHANPQISVQAFSEHPEILRTAKAREHLKQHGLALHFGTSNRTFIPWVNNFRRYVYACCSKCGELIDDRELKNVTAQVAADFELPLKLSETLVDNIPRLESQLARWWFECR
jgi:hypothetical protein